MAGQRQQGHSGRQSGRPTPRCVGCQAATRSSIFCASPPPRPGATTNSGERKEKTEWHQVAIFNDQLAKVAEQYLKKGAKVYLEGPAPDPQMGEGRHRALTRPEIVLQKFRGELQMLDSRGQGGGSDYPADRGGSDRGGSDFGQSRPGGNDRGGMGGGGGGRDMDDEIPFSDRWSIQSVNRDRFSCEWSMT